MNNPFFSIIVPVYKVEEYLDQCVHSVLTQSFKDYEVILVDDGSPDKCGAMCDSYAKKDSRVKVVHKNNGGLSSARNAGLEIASGEYVIFLDSDDFWDADDALICIHSHLIETNADVLVFPAKRYYGSDKKTTNIIRTKVERNAVTNPISSLAIEYLIRNNIYRAAAWNKVIKRRIIKMYDMSFKKGLLSEDMDWCGDLLLYSKKFDYYASPFYCYRQQRKGSITYGKTEKLVSDKLYMCRKGLTQAEEIQDNMMRRLLASYYAYEYSVAMGVSYGVKNKQVISEMKNLERLLDYDISDKVKKVNKLRKLVGFDLTRLALCLFVRIKAMKGL